MSEIPEGYANLSNEREKSIDEIAFRQLALKLICREADEVLKSYTNHNTIKKERKISIFRSKINVLIPKIIEVLKK